MKKSLLLSAVVAVSLASTQAFALSSFPSGTVGVGNSAPGTERSTGSTTTTTTTKSKGNRKGGNGRKK